jgi:threonine dehydrogenase-like Zn-dependent dehydrogenase
MQPNCAITAVTQFPWQAALAREMGAQETILSAEDSFARVSELTNSPLYAGRSGNRMIIGGFDVVFDCVGSAQTLGNALRWTRAKGTVILVGVNLHRMKVDLTPVWHQEVDLIGAVGHDVLEWQGESISTFDLGMRWMGAGVIDTDSLLTHRYPLAAYRQAFTTAVDKKQSRSIKVAFDL